MIQARLLIITKISRCEVQWGTRDFLYSGGICKAHLNWVIKVNMSNMGHMDIIPLSCDAQRRTQHHFCAVTAKCAGWNLKETQIKGYFTGVWRAGKQYFFKSRGGVPLWLTELRIWHYHCHSLSCCCGAGSIPGPGTSLCLGGCGQKKKKWGRVEGLLSIVHFVNFSL